MKWLHEKKLGEGSVKGRIKTQGLGAKRKKEGMAE